MNLVIYRINLNEGKARKNRVSASFANALFMSFAGMMANTSYS